jgi:all-trans-retinol 13,14-reductase
MSHKSDVVIIGSGISSLTSALLLSKRGKSVTVLEQYSKPGGYLHCFNRFGERYDTGAHYVGAMDPGQPFHTLLKYLGVYDDSLFVELDPTGFDVFHFPKFTLNLPKGYEGAIEAIVELFPNERAAITRYFDMIRAAVKEFPTYEFDGARGEIPALGIFETSLMQVVEALTSNTDLQCVLYTYCSLHGVEPQDVAFGFHAIVTDSLLRGAYGLRHGGDALAEKFVDLIRANGGQVLLKKTVKELKVRDRHVREVVTTEGEVFEADWVISGIHPKTTFALLDDRSNFPPVFTQRLEGLKESIGLFGIYAVSNSDMLSHLKNYYFFTSSDPKALFDIKPPGEIPRGAFISPACRDPIAGKATFPLNLHAAGPIEWFEQWRETRFAKRPEDYKKFKENFSENVFRLVDGYYPGFRDSITKYVTSSPLSNLHFNGTQDGAAYGLYHSMQNTGPRAIGPRTKVLNLLLTGQNSLFPGLLGASIAGLRTTGHITGIKPILGELSAMGANP